MYIQSPCNRSAASPFNIISQGWFPVTNVLTLACEVVFQAGRYFGSWREGADCISLLQSDQGQWRRPGREKEEGSFLHRHCRQQLTARSLPSVYLRETRDTFSREK